MTLEKRFAELPEGIESDDVVELRKALVRTQKQLKDAKNRTEELVDATIQATKDATIAMGAITPVSQPVIDKRKKSTEIAL